MEKQLTGTLALAVFTAALGSLQMGYSLGVINAPQKVIERHYAKSLGVYNEELAHRRGGNATEHEEPTDASVVMYWSLSVAIFAIGGMVSSFLVSFVSDFRGRIKGMLYINVLAITAGLLMGLSKLGTPYLMVIAGRAIMGLYCGLSSGLVPKIYVCRCPCYLQVIGLDFLLGNDDMWHVLLGLSGAPAILQSLLLLVCPESPRFLYIKQGKVEEACKSLKRLKGDYDTSKDIAEMQAEKEKAMKEAQTSILRLLRSSVYRQQLFVALMMHLSQQFSGINAIFYYSTSIFQSAGVGQPVYATIGVGVINIIFTLVSVILVDRAGRRTLTIVGLGGMCCCAVAMTVGLAFQDVYSWMSYLSMAAIFLFVSFFEIGPGPIPWFIVAEIFSQGPRPAAIALAGCCNWTCNFIIGMFFPYLEGLCGSYVFIVFAVLLFGFTVFIYLRVPETKGKTFEEIAAVFHRKRGAPLSKPQEEAEMVQLKSSTEA
ncbi:solute carrier family 2, facilitated glucose transporter member 2-like [Sinocyclocheilus grahami]|uniref:solute carrier family 2, facilitated glucose transporter member 2-like n=1 Tax=Sinocyclocheilus grahami TaxID=75366 RepID=UPI0007AC5984|nr:PREDICTED: solute carrier family 2, facilitated glucose transporter member 2-like [Sinocyclocheilus grahami]